MPTKVEINTIKKAIHRKLRVLELSPSQYAESVSEEIGVPAKSILIYISLTSTVVSIKGLNKILENLAMGKLERVIKRVVTIEYQLIN